MKKTIEKRTWVLLWVGWCAVALSQILSFSYGMMVPSIIEDFGLDYAKIGMVGSVAAWVAVFANIPVSGVAANANPRFALPVIYSFFGLGCLIFGTTHSLFGLYAGRIISGIAGTGLLTALVTIKVRRVPPERMVEINGIENFVQPIGQTCATLLMAQIMALLSGWRGVYNVICALMFLCGALWVLFYWTTENDVLPADSREKSAPEESVFHSLKLAMSNPVVWLYGLAYPGKIIIWIAFFYYYPSFFMDVRGFTAAQAGLATGLFPVFSAIASIVSPKISKRFDLNKSLLVGSGILLCGGYYAMLKLEGLVAICVASAVSGFLSYIATPIYFTNMYRLGLPPKAVQMATSFLLTMVSLGSALGAGVVGSLIDAWGFSRGLVLACYTPLWFSLLTAFTPSLSKSAMNKSKNSL